MIRPNVTRKPAVEKPTYSAACSAVVTIIRESISERTSLSAYKRICKALKTVGVPEVEYRHALERLGYVRFYTGEPYEWLAKLLEKK